MEEPSGDARLEDKAEISTDEAGNEKHERSHGVDDDGKEEQIEIATDEAINDEGYGGDYKIEIVTRETINVVEGINDKEGGKGTRVVNTDNAMMATEVNGDDDLEESDPSLEISGSEYGEEKGSENDEAYENTVEGEEDVEEDDEPVEEDFDDEDISEEEASEESDAGNDAQGEANTVERVGEEGSGQDPKEVKVKLKESSNKSSKRSKGVADKSMKLKPLDNPEPSGNIKGKRKVKSMGMIFFCNSKTKKDCFKYRVFGLPEGKKDTVDKIYKGMRIFLYNVDSKLMYGIYKAAGPGGYNIEPKAFKSQFPCQVRYTVLDDCSPLPEEKFKRVIKKNYYTRNKFDCKLNSLQVKQLCKLFIESRKELGRTKPVRGGPKAAAKPRPSSTHERTRMERPVSRRRTAPWAEPDYHDRPRKRAREILSPRPPPPAVPYSDPYRREIFPHRDRTHREDRDPPRPRRGHHYRDERAPLLEDREPLLISRDSSYRVAREPYLDSYRVARDSYLETHDPYKERRDPYLEPHDPYKVRRGDPYMEPLVDSYRDRRVAPSYLGTGRLDPYVDPYGSLYERDAYRDGGGRAEYRGIYGGGETFDRVDPRPLSVASSSRPRLEIGQQQQQQLVSPRERPPLYSEALYSLSRAPLARDYRL